VAFHDVTDLQARLVGGPREPQVNPHAVVADDVLGACRQGEEEEEEVSGGHDGHPKDHGDGDDDVAGVTDDHRTHPGSCRARAPRAR